MTDESLIEELVKESGSFRDSENAGMMHISKVLEIVKRHAPSEISVVDEGLLMKELIWQMGSDKSVAEYAETALEVLRPYLRAMEPVSVSLHEMFLRYNAATGFGMPSTVGEQTEKKGIRAVLDFIGVKYVD